MRRATDLKFGSLEQQRAQHAAAIKACGRLKGKTLVDVGCGYGDLLHSLPAGVTYIGVDNDFDKLDACVRLWPDHDFRHVNDSWEGDVVVSVAVLQAVSDMKKALQDWYKAASERLVVVCLQPWAYRDDNWAQEAKDCWEGFARRTTASGKDWECHVVVRRP